LVGSSRNRKNGGLNIYLAGGELKERQKVLSKKPKTPTISQISIKSDRLGGDFEFKKSWAITKGGMCKTAGFLEENRKRIDGHEGGRSPRMTKGQSSVLQRERTPTSHEGS